MNKGLTVFKNNNDTAALDADNAFWGITKNAQKNDSGLFIPRNLISLYEKNKEKLDKRMHTFRFSHELGAIYIDPTSRCNANCPYCYIPKEIRRHGKQMSKQELFLCLDKIAKHFKGKKRKAVIIFHASEPLLVKDIVFEGIRKFSRVFNFGLQTNATLFKKEDADFLMEYGVGVGISLDSYLQKENDILRPSLAAGGNFKKAVQAIEWFDGYHGLNVITTVTKFNVKSLPEIVKFLHSKKVGCVLLNPVRLTQKNARSIKAPEDLMAKYFIQAVDTAISLSQKSGRNIIVGNFANTILAIVAPEARRMMCDISPCGGGRCFLTITASGEMIPCGEFIGIKGFSGGNIFKTGLKEAMQSKPFKRIRARFVEKISECDACTLRNICGAPCPAELYSLGNMYQKSIFCKFYKKAIEHAFKILAQGKEQYCLRKEGLDNLRYDYYLK